MGQKCSNFLAGAQTSCHLLLARPLLIRTDTFSFSVPGVSKCFSVFLHKEQIDIRSLTAVLYGASKKSEHALALHACIARSVNELTKAKGSVLALGDAGWEELAEERRMIAGRHDFIATHQRVLVPQTAKTCIRLLEEERIETIVLPNASSVHAVTEGLKACGLTPEAIANKSTVICFGQKSASAATAAGYRIDTILSEPSTLELIEKLTAVPTIEK